jgi:hypothetical protein
MNLPYSSVASANTLIGIHVGIGEGGIIVTFWSAWNVMLFKTPEINKRNSKCQNIDELRTAMLQEWQQFPQERLRRLVRCMTRRATKLHNKRMEVFSIALKCRVFRF